MALSGRCLCGRVRFEVTGKTGPAACCHCQTCRRVQGVAYAVNAGVRERYFRLLSGDDVVREYESSPGKLRAFCSVCGSPLWSRRPDTPDVRRIRLGTLDGDPGRRPLAHIWLSQKAAWLELPDDGLARYDQDVPDPGPDER